MTLQILLLLAFQSVYGYVYHELAMLIGMFMAGIALGSWLGITRTRTDGVKPLIRASAINQLLLAVSAPLLLFLVGLLSRSSGATGTLWIAQVAFPLLAVLCGMPGGYQFPIATEVYLRDSRAHHGTGTLYALDLLGGCAGALLLAGFLIPVFGFWKTAWLAAVVSVVPALTAARASLDSATTSA
jgi:spermidine synthase